MNRVEAPVHTADRLPFANPELERTAALIEGRIAAFRVAPFVTINETALPMGGVTRTSFSVAGVEIAEEWRDDGEVMLPAKASEAVPVRKITLKGRDKDLRLTLHLATYSDGGSLVAFKIDDTPGNFARNHDVYYESHDREARGQDIVGGPMTLEDRQRITKVLLG